MRRVFRDGDRSIAICLTLLGLMMRVAAFQASLWDWDDVLFARALHRFDVSAHSPHPPGFPVFVMLGRAAYSLLGDEHLAYGAISLVFGSLLPASFFYFYREVFRDSTVALAGALIGSFAPSIWVYGGAPRSDGPALTLGVIGLTLALRGLHSPRSLLASGGLLGLSMGVRVTIGPLVAPALLVALVVRLRERRWRLVWATLGLAVAGTLFWYVPLVLHTGWHVYQYVVHEQTQYVLSVESILGASGGTPRARFVRFFVDIWGVRWLMWMIASFAIMGAALLVQRRQWRVVGWLATCFLPVMVFTVGLNAAEAGPLYSLPYIPLFSGLAAFGAITAPRVLFPRGPVGLDDGGRALVAAIVIAQLHWTYPIIEMLRREESPPVRAVRYVGATLDPDHDVLRYDPVFLPHVMLYLPHIKMRREGPATLNLIDPLVSLSPAWSLTTDPMPGTEGQSFRWSHPLGAGRLRPLSRDRYFSGYVTGPAPARLVLFLAGWYSQEHAGERTWRWMGRVSRTALLLSADVMTLHMRLTVPDPVERPTIVLRLDDVEVERFVAAGKVIDRTLTVRTRADRLWLVLTIETNAAFVPSRVLASADDRELALACDELTWSAARGAHPSVVSDDQFLGSGWHAYVSDARNGWRWTNGTGVVRLPPFSADGQLEMSLFVPAGTDGRRSMVTLALAGRMLDRFSAPTGLFSKTYRIPASAQRGGALALTISATPVVVPGDPQPRGVLVGHLGWAPAPGP